MHCSFINFDVLGYDNSNFGKNNDEIKNIILESVNNREAAKFPIFNCGGINDKESRPDNDFAKTIDLLKPAIDKMAEVFEEIADASCKIMSGHAPKFLAENLKSIIYNTLPFNIMGWYGAAAINSGALEKPGSDDIVSVCGYIG